MNDLNLIVDQLAELGYPPPNILRALCKLEGVDYAQIADAIGTSLSNVTAHMNTVRCNAKTQKRIANYFKIEKIEQIFENE